ncbi:MAG: hypothetical protein M3Q00_00635 [Pseudomonadota bacterium]|nr:hypothetical protein [Pseudomonadota bacterium]
MSQYADVAAIIAAARRLRGAVITDREAPALDSAHTILEDLLTVYAIESERRRMSESLAKMSRVTAKPTA